MGLTAHPLPSPLPTAPPSPRDVVRRLLIARQEDVETCAWVDGDFDNPVTCNLGYACVENDAASNQFCCDSVSFDSGSCGYGPTACVDSTAVTCGDNCIENSHTATCTEGTASICLSVTYLFSGGLAGWRCGPSSRTITAYDTYTNEDQSSTTFAPVIHTYSDDSSTVAAPSSTVPVPTSSPSTVNPTPAAVLPDSTPAPAHSGLSTGAKAGIAVGAIGAIAIIAGLIILLLFQKRKNNRRNQQNLASNFNNQPQMVQEHQPQPQPPPPQGPFIASPSLSQQHHMSMTSNPSATSTTPLTQANMRTMSQSPPPASEVLPSESASQIQSPIGGGSVLSGPSSPTGYGPGSSNTGSQEHSGLGPMPNYPTGASAFPHGGPAGGQSVLSNPNTFLSSPPVHAPGVDHYGGGQG